MTTPQLHRASKRLALGARSGFLALLLLLGACSPSDGPDPADAGDVSGDAPANLDSGSHIGPGGLSVLKLTPNRGPLEGAEEVDIQGTGFFDDAKVFFGEVEAEVTWRGGATHLFVLPPPRLIPGRVDVRVENPGIGSAVAKRAFTYLGQVRVDGFTPDRGPHLGGTLITVRGAGFGAGDRVLVGGRAAFQSEVVDSNTIVALTPGLLELSGSRAKVTVAVRHASGVTTAAGHFTYGRPPQVTHVDAALVPLTGGPVTLHGEALDNAETLYIGGAIAALADGTASSSRGAQVPARDLIAPGAGPGAVDLLITGPFGHTTLAPALAYVGGDKAALFGVSPAEGSTAGGNTVRLLADLAGGSASQVRFGSQSAKVETKGGSLLAKVPPGTAGVVDVTLVTSAGELSLKQAYRYRTPVGLSGVSPKSGPIAGGQTVQVAGTGLTEGCEVRFGPWRATVSAASAEGLAVTTPPGAPGAATVRVRCGAQEAALPGAYHYQGGGVSIDSVLPAEGATGGGTLVTIQGSGFTSDAAVYFDGQLGKALQVVDPSTLTVQSPAHEPGAVAVDVVQTAPGGGSESDTLIDGFTYFSPTNPQGGTYGGPLQGTLNVTVLNIYTLQPIDDAFVQVGQPGEADFPTYSGLTDDSGQIVFSGQDLQPPVTVSAAKAQFSASSIVNFEVGNATLLLFPWVPPSPGGGGGGPGLPLATLKGTVLDVDKYLLRPPTTCAKPSTGGPQCAFCETDQECSDTPGSAGKTWACVTTGGVSKRCFSECKQDADCDSKDFACVLDVVDGQRKVCQPSVGLREIRCETSTRGLDTENPEPGPGADVDEITGQFEITSRLDELAIYCVGGYRKGGVFRATAMGVRRHIFPQPGQTIEGLDVQLNIPLQRTLPIRLDHPQPFFPSGNGGDLTLEGWLHLGSDGYVPVADVARIAEEQESKTGVVDQLALVSQPLTLPQEMTDTTYTWRVVVDYSDQVTAAPMEAGTQHANVVRPGDDNVLLRKGGTWQEAHVGIATTLAAALPGDATAGEASDVLLLARDGRIFRGSVADPYVVWIPQVKDPYAKPPAVLAAAGTPTDATVVGEGGLVRRLRIDAGLATVVEESGGHDVDLLGVCHGPLGRVAVGAGGVVQVTVDGAWTKVPSGTTSELRAVACTAKGAVAVGAGATVVRIDLSGPVPKASAGTAQGAKELEGLALDPTGALIAVGTTTPGYGAVLRSTDGVSWKSVLPAGTKADALPKLRRVAVASEGTYLLADADGGVWWQTPLGITDESPQRRNVLPLSATILATGEALVVGEPGLWLGPFLTVPTVTRPKDVTTPKGIQIEWAFSPGPAASVTRVHLDGQGFPFWWLYVDPKSTAVALPDFQTLGNITVFLPLEVPYVARVDRIYAPELSINAFSTFDLEFGDWRSWSTNGKTFQIGQ